MDTYLYLTVYMLSSLITCRVSGTLLCPYNDTTMTINLSGHDLTTVTPATFTLDYNCTSYIGSTRIMDLSNNNIVHVDNNSFTGFLDLKTLNLSHNAISIIENGTFISLSGVLEYLYLGYNEFTTLTAGPYNLYKLKQIHFEHNNISYVEPGVVDDTNLNLLLFNMQYNTLTLLEPWPYMIGYTNGSREIFFDLQHNLIKRLSNNISWVYDLVHPYEVEVLLQYNLVETITIDDLKLYKSDLDTSDSFSLLLTLYLNITNNPYFCDCNLYFLADDLRSTILRWTRVDEFRYNCASPNEFHGVDWFHDLPLYHLVCDRTVNCPVNCSCQDRPHNDTFYIDCRGAGLTEFPETIPDTDRTKIELFLDDNEITSMKNTTFLSRLYNLSMSSNRLSSLDEDLLKLMPNLTLLNVQNNQIRSLPSYIQRFNADNVKLGGNPLFCDCDSIWLADWIGISVSSDSLSLTCDSDEGSHVINGLQKHDLNCTNEDLIIMFSFIGGALLLLVIIGLFVFRCPYESKVLLQKIFRVHPFDKYKVDDDDSKAADIYLVFDDDPDVIGWVKVFLNQLHKKKPHYKILNPYRFTETGAQEEQIRKWVGKTKRVIVVLSEKIFQNRWRMFETSVAEDNIINAMARNSNKENTGDVPTDETYTAVQNDAMDQNENYDDVLEAAPIIYIKFNNKFEEQLKKDPWQKRLLGKTVLTVGERMLMSKLRYELPLKGNGTNTDDNFRIAPRREDIARIKEDKKRPGGRANLYLEDETTSTDTAGIANRLIRLIDPSNSRDREAGGPSGSRESQRTDRMTVLNHTNNPRNTVNNHTNTPHNAVNNHTNTPHNAVNNHTNTPHNAVNNHTNTPQNTVNNHTKTPHNAINDSRRDSGPESGLVNTNIQMVKPNKTDKNGTHLKNTVTPSDPGKPDSGESSAGSSTPLRPSSSSHIDVTVRNTTPIVDVLKDPNQRSLETVCKFSNRMHQVNHSVC